MCPCCHRVSWGFATRFPRASCFIQFMVTAWGCSARGAMSCPRLGSSSDRGQQDIIPCHIRGGLFICCLVLISVSSSPLPFSSKPSVGKLQKGARAQDAEASTIAFDFLLFWLTSFLRSFPSLNYDPNARSTGFAYRSSTAHSKSWLPCLRVSPTRVVREELFGHLTSIKRQQNINV